MRVGAILALASVPLMWIAGEASIVVALLALLLYPILELPRIHVRSSWWLGAIVSTAVWIALFIWLTAAVEFFDHLGEASMLFLVPAMMFPAALVVSGLIRLEGRLKQRAPASEQRIAAVVVTVVCASFILVPVALNTLPALGEALTGDSPSNWEYSAEGDIVNASGDDITIKKANAQPETFHLEPSATFDFRGPGSAIVTGTAGRDWLKPGQRIALTFVRRDRQAWASHVNIWIDRKGCQGETRWTSITPSAPTDASSLAGTIWESVTGPADSARGSTFEFLADQQLAYQDSSGSRVTNGAWRQSGQSVIVGINECYALYEGRIDGDAISGEFSNEVGARAPWRARRRSGK